MYKWSHIKPIHHLPHACTLCGGEILRGKKGKKEGGREGGRDSGGERERERGTKEGRERQREEEL